MQRPGQAAWPPGGGGGSPRAWGPEPLYELRDKLKAAPEYFTEDNLQKAHHAVYQKPLVDLISMVKHAAHEQEPLLTAEERVARAFQAIARGRTFTADQHAWLVLIRTHLVANLSIDEGDFDVVPVLSRAGGWAPANRTFQQKLPELLHSLNEAIAA